MKPNNECESIAANETCSISICYLNHAIGLYNDTLIIEGESLAPSTIPLSAIVVRPIKVNPMRLGLGELRVGLNSTYPLNIQNLSSRNITINIASENHNAFTIDQAVLLIQANSSYSYTLNFTPKTYGLISSNLNFTYTFSDLPLETSINVSAIGIYEIGDIGPSGGTIYMTPLNLGNGLYYEIQNSDYIDGSIYMHQWGCGDTMVDSTSSNIGDGKNNSNLISNVCQGIEIAAKYCNLLVVSNNSVNYSDWFLPTVFELQNNNLFTLINNIGISYKYWTSKTNSLNQALAINFNGPPYQVTLYKTEQAKVRCIRSFSPVELN